MDFPVGRDCGCHGFFVSEFGLEAKAGEGFANLVAGWFGQGLGHGSFCACVGGCSKNRIFCRML